MFQSIGIDADKHIKHLERLNPKWSKVCLAPILIKIDCYKMRLSMLKNAKNLVYTSEYNRVSISPD